MDAMKRSRLHPLMKHLPVAFAACAIYAASVGAQQTTLLVDVDHRPAMSLDGPWHAIVDPYRGGWGDDPAKPSLNGYAKNRQASNPSELVEYNFATSPTLNVPGDWNSQRESLLLYEGMVWYEKDFAFHATPRSRTFLHFGAANYAAHVFVDGAHVCDHEGGFTPFDCEVSNVVKDGDNFVVVAVEDDRKADRVPALKTDWWNYGGLTRDVSLVSVPQSFIDDYSLQLERGSSNHLSGYVHLEGAAAGTRVSLEIPDLKQHQTAETSADGRARFSFSADGLERWSPEHPRLYRVEMKAGEDTLADEVGFRTIEAKGDQILLNGEPVFLRGINIHAEAPYRSGRAWSEEDAETLLGWAHDLHCNFVRLAHYPHDERMARVADRLGIMVWSEVPTYWSIAWTDSHAHEIARQQLKENIRRDHNKAAVIIWSVSNETPRSPERLAFLKDLVAVAHGDDPTRLVTSAMLTHFDGTRAILDDPLGTDLDVLGYNEYIGWYQGQPEDAAKYTWENPMGKPLIMSEFGGGAVAGMHGDATARFTEEYQANVYEQQFAMLNKIPFLRGMTPWVLMDFRSPTRQLPHVQDFYNRKGLVSDLGAKKKAFFVVQDYYRQRMASSSAR
jgi:beta-glucuronidase